MRNVTARKLPASPAPTHAPESADLKRRRFLLALGAGSAGAVAVTAGALPAMATARAEAAATDQDSAYRVTEHVRDYYRTTRI
jgi:hypothetical protein